MTSFKNDFIEKLEKLYPEKVIELMGMEFNEYYFSKYIKDNLLSEHTFSTKKFKKWLVNETTPDYTSAYAGIPSTINMPVTYNTGDIVYDISDNNMKVYDGNNWVSVVANQHDLNYPIDNSGL